MFPGIGTVINVVAIICGGSIGVLVGNRLSVKTRTLTTDVLGLVTLLGAASALMPMWSSQFRLAFPSGWPLLVILGSLLVGGLIGSALKLEEKLDSLESRSIENNKMISDIKSMVQTVVNKRNDKILSWGVGIIIALGGVIGWFITHYVIK